MNARIARLFCTICSTWRNFSVVRQDSNTTTVRCDGCGESHSLDTREFKVGQRI